MNLRPWLLALVCFTVVLATGMVPVVSGQDAAPTPTPTPLPGLELPDWLRDPEAVVYVTFAYEEIDTEDLPTLINVTTGERHVLDLPYVDSVRWLQAADGLYMILQQHSDSRSDGFDEYVFVQTGELTRFPLHDPQAPQRPDPEPLQPIDNGDGVTVEIVLESSVVRWIPFTRRYEVINEVRAVLENPADGISQEIPVLRTGYDPSARFSIHWRAGGQYLTIARSIQKYILQPGWQPNPYDTGTAQRIAVYDTGGNRVDYFRTATKVSWYPGEPLQLLYVDLDWNAERGICYAIIGESVAECGFLEQWQQQNNAFVHRFEWSRDGNKIIFLYNHEDERGGGLCLYDLQTESITCPLEVEITEEGTLGSRYRYFYPNQYGVFSYGNAPSDPEDFNTRRERELCLLDQTSYEIDCIIADLLPEQSDYRTSIMSPSKELLAVAYTVQGYDDALCIVDLQTGAVSCPISPEDLQYGLVDVFGWSPNSDYVVVVFTSGGPMSDDKTFAHFGFIDVANGTYRDEGHAMYENRLSELWRPSP